MTATLHIQTALRKEVTFLKNTFFTTPFKVANITEDKKSPTLHLMLMSSSPGILDGDNYQLKIELEEGCSLQLYTQSYQRLFNMKQSATQLMEVQLAPYASFCFLPHPSVPHASSVFKATNKIYLAGNCSLVFGEILTCGRKLNGEVFLFSKYQNITEVFICDRLVIKENLLIEPLAIDVNAIGQLEGFTHQASLIYLHPTAKIKPLSELVTELLASEPGVVFGLTEAPVNGLIVRMLGNKAEQLHNCLKNIATILPQQTHFKAIANAV